MCGIFGFIGKESGEKKALSIVVDGIQRLDYRGYDSSGAACVVDGKLLLEKRVGSVSYLREALEMRQWAANMAIAHTRWCTHGSATVDNAHPHIDAKGECAVVHNGIIENFATVRLKLEKKGVIFRSDTDTEVISQLIGHLYRGNLLKAVRRSIALLEGAFAISVIHQNHPEEIVCATKECPLAIGMGQEGTFISSDAAAFLPYAKQAIHLGSSEVALVRSHTVEVFDAYFKRVVKKKEELAMHAQTEGLGRFSHYLEKEIFEQPHTALAAMEGRLCQEKGIAFFEELSLTQEELSQVHRVVIVGCGTSFHAGLLAKYLIEERARIPVDVEISSEFRYKNPLVGKNTLAIAISQSGETADTIAAVHELKKKGARVMGICNVSGSTLTREVDTTLMLRAGAEISVASSKAFTSQLIVLALFTLHLARAKGMGQKEGKEFARSLLLAPMHLADVLKGASAIEKIAEQYLSFEDFFFLGRRFMYPTALEAALKLKEIAYVNANGYAAGEMKHGPIALIDEKKVVLTFCADRVTHSKMVSNLMEIKARGGKTIAITHSGDQEIPAIADHTLFIPESSDELSALSTTVVGQLFAYYFARKRGRNVDKPRNLAKSVTVE